MDKGRGIIMSRMTSFEATKDEMVLMEKVADRAESLEIVRGSRIGLLMDLMAVNANGCPMDFERLLNFPGGEFSHDIHGIQYNINRNTGKLKDGFVPRCSRPECEDK